MAFSADGARLASSDTAGSIIIWDWLGKAPNESSIQLKGHSTAPHALRFFDDDKRLISLAMDNTLRTWELDHERLVQRAKGIAGRDLSDDERQQFGIESQ